MRDLVVTWPKTRALAAYLRELENARQLGEVINFRVWSPPTLDGDEATRCYRVHDGMVRGYTRVLRVEWKGAGAVRRVPSDPRSPFWPEGWYIVCEPVWNEVHETFFMPGFQGYRYMEREAVPA